MQCHLQSAVVQLSTVQSQLLFCKLTTVFHTWLISQHLKLAKSPLLGARLSYTRKEKWRNDWGNCRLARIDRHHQLKRSRNQSWRLERMKQLLRDHQRILQTATHELFTELKLILNLCTILTRNQVFRSKNVTILVQKYAFFNVQWQMAINPNHRPLKWTANNINSNQRKMDM